MILIWKIKHYFQVFSMLSGEKNVVYRVIENRMLIIIVL